MNEAKEFHFKVVIPAEVAVEEFDPSVLEAITAAQVSEAEADAEEWGNEPDGHCSVCDGIGHGYPGGGPCPLEDTGWADREDGFDDWGADWGC